MHDPTDWFVAVLPTSLALAGPADAIRRALPDAFALHGGVATGSRSGADIGLVPVGRLDVRQDHLDVWVIIAETPEREALSAVRLPPDAARFAVLSRDRRHLRCFERFDFRTLPPGQRRFHTLRVHHHDAAAIERPPASRPRAVREVWPPPGAAPAAGRDAGSAAAARFIAGLCALRLSHFLEPHLVDDDGAAR